MIDLRRQHEVVQPFYWQTMLVLGILTGVEQNRQHHSSHKDYLILVESLEGALWEGEIELKVGRCLRQQFHGEELLVIG